MNETVGESMGVDGVAMLFERLGITVGILVVIGIALWRTGRWLAPRADTFVSKHFKLVDGVVENQVKYGVTLDRLATLVDGIAKNQEHLAAGQKETSKSLQRVAEHLESVDLCARGRKKGRARPK